MAEVMWVCEGSREESSCARVTALIHAVTAHATGTTVNSRLADTPLLRTLAITDKIQIPGYRGLTENDSRYYGLSLIRTLNEVPSVSAIKRVDWLTKCKADRTATKADKIYLTF